jgi:hypothetical protein
VISKSFEFCRSYNATKGGMVRKRHLAKLIAVAAFCLLGGAQVWAGCNSYTDAYGNTSIFCDDGTTGNLYTDPYMKYIRFIRR